MQTSRSARDAISENSKCKTSTSLVIACSFRGKPRHFLWRNINLRVLFDAHISFHSALISLIYYVSLFAMNFSLLDSKEKRPQLTAMKKNEACKPCSCHESTSSHDKRMHTLKLANKQVNICNDRLCGCVVAAKTIPKQEANKSPRLKCNSHIRLT